MSDKRRPVLQSPHIWCFTTYFAEGFPFTVIRTLSSLFFRDSKVSLEAIGLTGLYGLPWALKFLWGPQIDEFGTRRSWMLTLQLMLAALIVTAGVFAPLQSGVQIIAGLFFLGAILAATHDMAIDGYYMAALDKEGQTKFLGYRVMAYRIAMMTGTGVVATIGTTQGWMLGFVSGGALLALLWLYHMFFLPRVEAPQRPVRELLRRVFKMNVVLIAVGFGLLVWGLRTYTESPHLADLKKFYPAMKPINFPNVVSLILLLALVVAAVTRKKLQAALTKRDSFYARAFVDFLSRSGIGHILAFVIFLRTGEFMLSSMVSPFIVDLGIKEHYGWLSSVVGLPCSIIGAIAGGMLLARYGMRRLLWPFLLAQNLTNLIYMALALYLQTWVAQNTGQAQPTFMGYENLGLVAFVHGFDNFAGGLGTSVLTVYLMRICSEKFRAAHFAIGSGLMAISGVFAGIAGGYVAGAWGYGANFGISFLASVPGMLLAFFLPADESRSAPDEG